MHKIKGPIKFGKGQPVPSEIIKLVKDKLGLKKPEIKTKIKKSKSKKK